MTFFRRIETGTLFKDGQALIARSDGLFIALNQVGWEIWEQLEYPHTIDQLTQSLQYEFDIDAVVCRSAVDDFLSELDAAGLLLRSAQPNPERQATFRYLYLLKRSLSGMMDIESALRIDFLQKQPADQPADIRQHFPDIRYRQPETYAAAQRVHRVGSFTLRAFRESLATSVTYSPTMVGLQRLNNVERLAEQIFAEGITGDFIEAGVCRGGVAIFMRALQRMYGEFSRKVWLADSFQGLPVSTASQDINTGLDLTATRYPELAASQQQVLDNFRLYDLLDEGVQCLPGWFADTLPKAPIEKLALIRADGDLYSSTMEILVNLYDRLSPGGFIIIDDYFALKVCQQAVDEFRDARGIVAPIQLIDQYSIYWRREV